MRKSKRQHQTDLLTKLLDRVAKGSETNQCKADADDISWIHKKMSEVAGGDIELDSGGLNAGAMHKANRMLNKYSQQPSPGSEQSNVNQSQSI